MQEVSVRKAFISVFIFTAAFVMGVVMSSPASAQTDVVIEHRGMCHDAAWFATQPYQFDPMRFSPERAEEQGRHLPQHVDHR